MSHKKLGLYDVKYIASGHNLQMGYLSARRAIAMSGVKLSKEELLAIMRS